MPRVFISHSSRDNAEAEMLIDWLRSNGFDEVFLDIDKHAGIPPGIEWERKLYSEVSRSTAVLLLLTKNWHESKWCFVEFAQARALRKDIIPVLVTADGAQFIGDSLQQINLTENRDEGLERLLHRLHEIGRIGPEGFSLPPGRPPYPGLLSFDRDDAAIYFGRSELVRQNLGTLEQFRIRGGERLLLLHGESGSGKSSLLKAGLLPQLERRKCEWHCLSVSRPGANPTSEFRAVLLTALGSDHRAVIDALLTDPSVDHARAVVDVLHDQRGNHQTTVLLVIDQLEELLTLAPARERSRFVAILEAMLAPVLRTLAIATVRTAELSGMHEALALPMCDQLIGPFPLDRLPEIIRKPAQVVGLSVDDRLIAAIVRDAATPDMLPLVAFLLRQLYDRHGSDHRLTLEEYQSLGDARAGLTPLEACVRTAADRAIARVKPTDAELQALREVFVPGLVRVDERGQFARQPLAAVRIPAESTRLIEALIADRLLVRRGETVDVAHEALFKVWPFLRELLAEEFEFLQGMTQLNASINDYLQLPPETRDQALLTGLRLSRNETWLARHPTRFGEQQRNYIHESITARDQALARRRRLQRNILIASVASTLLFGVLGGFAWVQRNVAVESTAQSVEARKEAEASLVEVEKQRAEAVRQQAIAEQATAQAVEAREQTEAEKAFAERTAAELEATLARSNYFLAGARWKEGRGREAQQFLHNVPRQHRNFEWYLSNRLFEGGYMTLYGHRSDVRSVAFSPDGTRIASGGDDSTIKLWDAVSGQELRTLQGHKSFINSLAFSPDGTRIASGSLDKTIKLWDASSGRELRTLEGHEDLVFSVAFSPDGTRIASASRGAIKVWGASSGREVHTLGGNTKGARCVTFSPDGTRIASGGWDEPIKLWDAGSGQELRSFRGHNTNVESVAFSPDGTRIAAAGRDESWSSGHLLSSVKGTITLWETASGQKLHTLEGQTGEVECVAFSPDGMLLASASSEATIKLWGVGSGQELATFPGHKGRVSSVAFSPDGMRIASAGDDATIRLWEVARTPEFLFLDLYAGALSSNVAFSPDGTRIAAGSSKGRITVWDASTGRELRTLEGQAERVLSLAFSPDGSRIASGGESGIVKLWDEPGGQELHTLKGHAEQVSSVVFSPDGTKIASGSMDCTIKVWDATSGRELRTLEGGGEVLFVTFSPDGTRMASGSERATKLWDVASGQELREIEVLTELEAFGVFFSPDGTRIASASDVGFHLRDVDSGEWEHSWILEGHKGRFSSVAFSPDWTRIATGSDDQTIKLWDADSDQELCTLLHSHQVESVTFSPDGTRIASGSADGLIRLWDVASGQEVRMLKSRESVAFSPDGTRIALVSGKGLVELWDAESGRELRTFKGLKSWPTKSVAFSLDGTLILSRDWFETEFFWDVTTGEPVETADAVEWYKSGERSPNGRWLVGKIGYDFGLIDLEFKNTPREKTIRQMKARPDPWSHFGLAEIAHTNGDRYAETFHCAWIIRCLAITGLRESALSDNAPELLRNAYSQWKESIENTSNGELPDPDILLHPTVRDVLRSLDE